MSIPHPSIHPLFITRLAAGRRLIRPHHLPLRPLLAPSHSRAPRHLARAQTTLQAPSLPPARPASDEAPLTSSQSGQRETRGLSDLAHARLSRSSSRPPQPTPTPLHLVFTPFARTSSTQIAAQDVTDTRIHPQPRSPPPPPSFCNLATCSISHHRLRRCARQHGRHSQQ